MKAAGADVVIASIHSGIKGASDTIPENQTDAVAQQVSGIDAILCGHTHKGKTYLTYKNPDGKIVPIVEPKNGDGIFSQIDLKIDADGNFTGVDVKNVTLAADAVADSAILEIAKPYQDATLVYTNTVLGKSTDIFEGAKQLTEPSSIMELVNKVQAAGAGTTLSIAAPLSLAAKVPQGDVKRQDIMGVYVYENFLFGVNMTGSQLKNWLEWSVRYYAQVSNATDPIIKDAKLNIANYNLDQLYGATYDIDITQPACTVDSTGKVITGNRIKNLKINDVLVKDTEVLKVAINNYRYNGGGGFMAAAGFVPGSQATIDATFYDSAKVLGDDGQVRNMMFKYVEVNKTISPTNSNNWKISTTAITPPVKAGWNIIDGKWYFGNSNGIATIGWVSSGNRWYYLGNDFVMKTGWALVNNKWYYLESNGDMKTGWALINNNWYYLSSNGDMKTGWNMLNNKWYYLASNGDMKTGWNLINSKWYYLRSSGDMAFSTIINEYKINWNGAWVQ